MKIRPLANARPLLLSIAVATALTVSACSDNDDDDPVDTTDTTESSVNVVAPLSPDITVPVATAPGATGEANFTVDTETGAVSGTAAVSGTTGTPTAAHIHAGAVGEAGAIVIGLEGNDDGTVWTAPADATLDAAGIDLFNQGQLYVNVHTDANPDGELRAQLANPGTATTFLVRLENVSTPETLNTGDGNTVAVPLSPGAYLVHQETFSPLLEPRDPASTALEQVAEDGNPAEFPATVPGSVVFNTPVGADAPGPLLPGGAYEFTIEASMGDQLSLVTMFVQSNDWFYTTTNDSDAIALFDAEGNAVSGDFSSDLSLWESGTEVDETPGVGENQAPRQTGPNVGEAEEGTVGALAGRDKSADLNSEVVRLTITAQ